MDLFKMLGLDSVVEQNDFKVDELGNGTHFYKHLPKLGEKYWLFTFFHKANEQEVDVVKSALLAKADVSSSKAIEELFTILSKNNGVQLYSNSLILYGITSKVDYLYLSEPNSIEKNNKFLPKSVNPSWIAIGYYSMSSTINPLLFIDASLPTENCFSAIVTNAGVQIVKKWNSIKDMLTDCIEQLKTHYDCLGYKNDADLSKPILTRNKTYIQ